MRIFSAVCKFFGATDLAADGAHSPRNTVFASYTTLTAGPLMDYSTGCKAELYLV